MSWPLCGHKVGDGHPEGTGAPRGQAPREDRRPEGQALRGNSSSLRWSWTLTPLIVRATVRGESSHLHCANQETVGQRGNGNGCVLSPYAKPGTWHTLTLWTEQPSPQWPGWQREWTALTGPQSRFPCLLHHSRMEFFGGWGVEGQDPTLVGHQSWPPLCLSLPPCLHTEERTCESPARRGPSAGHIRHQPCGTLMLDIQPPE